jgi:hypothetical protein
LINFDYRNVGFITIVIDYSKLIVQMYFYLAIA